MDRFNSKLVPAAILSAALVGGCGGGGGGGGEAAPGIAQSVTAMIAFVSSLIAGTDETSDPIDINALSLAADDKAEPAPL
jgi:hypothetical protein